jgi:hypothetical protein
MSRLFFWSFIVPLAQPLAKNKKSHKIDDFAAFSCLDRVTKI